MNSDLLPSLIVCSDPKEAEAYSEIVRQVTGASVDLLSSLDRALETLRKTDYLLVLLDHQALGSETSLLDSLEKIKRAQPRTEVLVATSSGRLEEAVAAMRMGAQDYLQKPVAPESLKLSVQRIWNQRELFHSTSQAAEFHQLMTTCQRISGLLDSAKVLQAVRSYFQTELSCQSAAIYKVEDGTPMKMPDGVEKLTATEEMARDLLDMTLKDQIPLVEMSEAKELFRHFPKTPKTPEIAIFRFRFTGQRDFFCIGLGPQLPQDQQTLRNRLEILQAQLETVSKTLEQYGGLKQLAFQDESTGLSNVRSLHQALDREFSTPVPVQQSFAVLFLDLDEFKKVNDTHGHGVGTQTLQAFAHLLKKTLRGSDHVYRYGGDEFVAVLPKTDLSSASQVAERIRHSLESSPLLPQPGLPVTLTVSIGIALAPDHGTDRLSLLNAADRAMYEAKSLGRNRVRIADAIKEK